MGAKFGDDWRKLRKPFDSVFSSHAVLENKKRFHVEIQQWIQGLAPLKENVIDTTVAFKFFIFRALALHLYEDAFDDRVCLSYSPYPVLIHPGMF